MNEQKSRRIVSSLSNFNPDRLCEKHRAEFDKQQERLKTQCSWCESRKASEGRTRTDAVMNALMGLALVIAVVCLALFTLAMFGPQQ